MATAENEILAKKSPRSVEAARVDTKLEVIVIPVSDVDRAKEYYTSLGWRLDIDFENGVDFRVVQFTPRGSGCSVTFGKNVTTATPGSSQAMLVVSDIEAAHAELLARSIDVSEVYHCAKGFGCRFPGRLGRISGPHPEHLSYGSFFSFCDPDGNAWQFQEITRRLPGRITGDMTYSSVSDLSQALRRVASAHPQRQKRDGSPDPDWADWCADFMLREQKGEAMHD
jgi:catechol 2,3-dioxygenase-like lactoylglutathione lyase family enzyme